MQQAERIAKEQFGEKRPIDMHRKREAKVTNGNFTTVTFTQQVIVLQRVVKTTSAAHDHKIMRQVVFLQSRADHYGIKTRRKIEMASMYMKGKIY